MASVWKRLQRVNKRAAKFQYTASYHRIDLETTSKWKPNKLSVVWTRRSRREITEALAWEPSLKDPLSGCVIWAVPENHSVAVTLFKDSRTNELEDKDWTFVLEDVSGTGKRRRLAAAALNMRAHASLEPTQRSLTLPLEPLTQKIVSATLQLTLHCVLLREGQATDEDMQSLASLFSVNNNSDIAPLEELDDEDYSFSDNSTSIRQVLEMTQQMEQMTNSLAATPISIASLNFDNSRTPTAPVTPSTPVPEDSKQLTPKAPEQDLRIVETPNSTQKRQEMLSNLTRMTMRNDYMNTAFNPKPNMDVQPKSSESIKVFKTRQILKHNLKPLELKTNLNSVSMDVNEDQMSPSDEKTPVVAEQTGHLIPTRIEIKEKTPVQDLLEWCKEVTSEYRQCKVTNLTTSWRNGLAFCAIIHHFRPDLIDFSGLQPEEAEQNMRTALEASAKLGISQVLTAPDICNKPVPDRLAVMTHLFQLRAHFTGAELQVEQLGNDTTESSYLVGRHDTDGALPAELFRREVSMRRSKNMSNGTRPSSQDSFDSQNSQERAMSPEKTHSPTSVKDVRGLFLTQSKNILGKMLSPTKDKPATQKPVREGSIEKNPSARWFTDPLGASRGGGEVKQVKPIKLMTRKQLTDPFGSDEDDEEIATLQTDTPKSETKSQLSEQDNQLKSPSQVNASKRPSPPEALPKPTPQLLSRHDELKERARQLLESAKREAREKERSPGDEENQASEVVTNGGPRNGETSPRKMTEEARQAQLRERARRLIADARAGIVSPTSPVSPSRPRHGTVEIISRQSLVDEIAAAGGVEQLDNLLARRSSGETPDSCKTIGSPDTGEDGGSEHSQSPSLGGDVSAIISTSPLHSFSALVDRLTPDKDQDAEDEEGEGGSYIASEIEALEREQSAIDERAAQLEKQLRSVMESADNTEDEDRLMSQWFNLVNKKNALLRRQMQLNILEQEEDLSRRCNLLDRELRLSLQVEEWRKTPGQRRRERLLLQELLHAVNERDRLVQEMDGQERAIADDDEIERNLTQVEIQRKNNCILQ